LPVAVMMTPSPREVKLQTRVRLDGPRSSTCWPCSSTWSMIASRGRRHSSIPGWPPATA